MCIIKQTKITNINDNNNNEFNNINNIELDNLNIENGSNVKVNEIEGNLIKKKVDLTKLPIIQGLGAKKNIC